MRTGGGHRFFGFVEGWSRRGAAAAARKAVVTADGQTARRSLEGALSRSEFTQKREHEFERVLRSL